MFPSKVETYWQRLAHVTSDMLGSSVESYKQYKDNIKPYVENDADLCIPMYIKKEGVYGIATTGIFLFMAKYYRDLDFPPFLFATVSDDATLESNVDLLLNVFFQSRFYYMMTGKYLPIVVYIDMLSEYNSKGVKKSCSHAVTCVYLPTYHENSSISTWYRIYIDSSGVSYMMCSKSFVRFGTIENMVLQRYKMGIYYAQLDTDIQINEIFCVGNVQKNFGTCAHWSTLLALLFVYNYDYLTDKLKRNPIYVTQWFNQLSQLTEQPEQMGHFIEIFLKIRRVFYTHFMEVLEHMKPLKDESKKEKKMSDSDEEGEDDGDGDGDSDGDSDDEGEGDGDSDEEGDGDSDEKGDDGNKNEYQEVDEEFIPNKGSPSELFLKGTLLGITDQAGFKSTALDTTDAIQQDSIRSMVAEVKSLFAQTFRDMEGLIKLHQTARRESRADPTAVSSVSVPEPPQPRHPSQKRVQKESPERSSFRAKRRHVQEKQDSE
jgi:hypothetical protein